MQITFYILLAIIAYTYIGYGLVLILLNSFKKNKSPKPENNPLEVTLLIAAYNESRILTQKIKNSLSLDYPKSKLKIAIVTDGSTDSSRKIIEQYPYIIHYHKDERRGKINAINRIMPKIKSQITVFSDANVMLNKNAIFELIKHFSNENTAVVSGEKVILKDKNATASSSGEGFYWKYESFLKKMDAKLNTLVGSAGELFAIRTQLYSEVKEDTIIEDFFMTMSLASRGFKVEYEPKAIATETGSLNMKEEEKRKVRISAGGIQAITRLISLLKFWKHPLLTFQYLSHRVFRWTLTPLALFLIVPINALLLSQGLIFILVFTAQILFYLLAFFGYLLRNKSIKYKVIHIPYYFLFMNTCVIKGWIRFFKNSQNVTWEKSERIMTSKFVFATESNN
ncbi:glycosyltransferase family 2 protein [Hyphobacterium sp. CCMP332]|nr:glycosyltransferase family 2 protein [Hyphobacterium sp. CCMP332]